MAKNYRNLCEEVDAASEKLGKANRTVEKSLRAIKPIAVVDGKELPQTIHFTDPLSNRLGGTD